MLGLELIVERLWIVIIDKYEWVRRFELLECTEDQGMPIAWITYIAITESADSCVLAIVPAPQAGFW
jgi:hypothetical protein